MTTDKSNHAAGRLYGRRKGPSLRARGVRLIDELLPKVRIDPDLSDPFSQFDNPVRAIWLEIGFGGGEHLAWQARHNPDTGFIGCEPFINGIAKLLGIIEDDGLHNVRVFDGDARNLLDGMNDDVLERVFLLFPDPWPKRRHHKRRFITQQTLDGLHRVLRPGGVLRMASDIPDYIRWTLSEIHRHQGFQWQAERPQDWRVRRHDWPQTRYEAKALSEGRVPCYLEFCRQPLR